MKKVKKVVKPKPSASDRAAMACYKEVQAILTRRGFMLKPRPRPTMQEIKPGSWAIVVEAEIELVPVPKKP